MIKCVFGSITILERERKYIVYLNVNQCLVSGSLNVASPFSSFRSLSELEGVKIGGDTGDKIRQVTERATLFRITSNAMINVSHP